MPGASSNRARTNSCWRAAACTRSCGHGSPVGTWGLDGGVEAGVQENLYRLLGGKTVSASAHRLSTSAAMDRLVVMDAGRIVEQGTHEQLLARGGLYAQLWQRQSGGFLELDAEIADDA